MGTVHLNTHTSPEGFYLLSATYHQKVIVHRLNLFLTYIRFGHAVIFPYLPIVSNELYSFQKSSLSFVHTQLLNLDILYFYISLLWTVLGQRGRGKRQAV